MKRIISLILVIVLFFYAAPKPVAKAAGADIALAAAAAYMVANASGMIFNMDGALGTAQMYMQQQVQGWLGERKIEDVFGSVIAKKVASKMIIPTTAYNAIKEFLNSYKNGKGISDTEKNVGGGTEGYEADKSYDEISIGGFTALESGLTDGSADTNKRCFWTYQWNGVVKTKTSGTWRKETLSNQGFGIILNSKTSCQVVGMFTNQYGATTYPLETITGIDGYEIKARTDDWNPPDVGIGYQWEGYMDGAMPDTNLEQLTREIFNNVDTNTISVDGEVKEADPDPTPAPTTPPAEDILEGINDIIGQLDSVKEGMGEITGSMTETIEGTAEAVESIEGTLSDALAMPDSEELPDFKFDLREFFPFCIPFDIYNLLSRFDASPTAPHVQIPFNIASIGFEYNIDLDFSAFDSVAEIMRTVEFIVYAIGLALVTGKVIKW